MGSLETVVLLGAYPLSRERIGYVRALDRAGIDVVHLEVKGILGGGIWDSARSVGPDRSLILNPQQQKMLPLDLHRINSSTALLDIDCFAHSAKRRTWSQLYDYVFVFHPRCKTYFEVTHPLVTLLPHAVDGSTILPAETQPKYEVGWVGSLEGRRYRKRRHLLNELDRRFKMNAWRLRYSEEETSSIYRDSKIVVNIGRDDYPEDANLRAFEAMGSGALLITRLPNELEELGFVPNRHFVGYVEESELFQSVRYFLRNNEQRMRIAESGQSLVLSEHTYDNRVKTILDTVGDLQDRQAPVRRWPVSRLLALGLDYCVSHRSVYSTVRILRDSMSEGIPNVISEFRAIRSQSRR